MQLALFTLVPPIFLPAEGQVASNVPILASLPMLSIPILAFSVTAHCAEYMFQLSTSFQRRSKATVELTFVRQASSFRFLRIREYPANEMSQPLLFVMPLRYRPSASLAGHSTDRENVRETLALPFKRLKSDSGADMDS